MPAMVIAPPPQPHPQSNQPAMPPNNRGMTYELHAPDSSPGHGVELEGSPGATELEAPTPEGSLSAVSPVSRDASLLSPRGEGSTAAVSPVSRDTPVLAQKAF